MHIPNAKVIPADDARRLIAPILSRRMSGSDLERAIERELLFGDEYDRSGVLALPDGAVIGGDLVLDHDAADYDGKPYRGVLALGRLTVAGDILNDDCDAGPFLVALGPLYAHHILKGGSAMIAAGPVTASGMILCEYNHGVFRAWDGVTAQGLIIDDQRHEIVGPVDAIKLVMPGDDVRRFLLPEFIQEDEDESCDSEPTDSLTEVLKSHILAGQPIFRPDAPRTSPRRRS